MYSRTQITSLCVVKLLRLSTIHELCWMNLLICLLVHNLYHCIDTTGFADTCNTVRDLRAQWAFLLQKVLSSLPPI